MRSVRNLKSRIFNFEVRCAEIISHGLVSGKGKVSVLRRLKRELIELRETVRLKDSEANELWLNCLKAYRFARRGGRDNRSVYLKFKRLLPRLETFSVGLVRNIESDEKRVYLSRLFDKGIFYLCSSHKNCAADHLDHQGKIYVSEDWEARCSTDKERSMVGSYIRNHRVGTVQAIVGSPVYMITRPNCRHFFRRVSVSDVLENSRNKLLKKYGMNIDNSKLKEVYMYREYYRRLRLLLTLRSTCPCGELEADIKKTRKLVRKWYEKTTT